jgi:hypothetical protein
MVPMSKYKVLFYFISLIVSYFSCTTFLMQYSSASGNLKWKILLGDVVSFRKYVTVQFECGDWQNCCRNPCWNNWHSCTIKEIPNDFLCKSLSFLAFYPFIVLNKVELLWVNRLLATCRNYPTIFSSSFRQNGYIYNILYMFVGACVRACLCARSKL